MRKRQGEGELGEYLTVPCYIWIDQDKVKNGQVIEELEPSTVPHQCLYRCSQS